MFFYSEISLTLCKGFLIVKIIVLWWERTDLYVQTVPLFVMPF